MTIQARIAQLVAYRLDTGEVPGSIPGKGENFSMKITIWLNSNLNTAMSLDSMWALWYMVDVLAEDCEESHDTLKQKYKHDEYPQVRKSGVDAVHETCPQRSNM